MSYCPICSALEKTRERRPDGNSICELPLKGLDGYGQFKEWYRQHPTSAAAYLSAAIELARHPHLITKQEAT